MYGVAWTDKDAELMNELWNKGCKVKDIAIALGRTFGSVQQRIYKSQHTKRRHRKDWSNDEINSLAANINKMSWPELEQHFGRSELSIKAAGYRYGIQKRVERMACTEEFDFDKLARRNRKDYARRSATEKEKYRQFCSHLVKTKNLANHPIWKVVEVVINAWRKGDIGEEEI